MDAPGVFMIAGVPASAGLRPGVVQKKPGPQNIKLICSCIDANLSMIHATWRSLTSYCHDSIWCPKPFQEKVREAVLIVSS